MKNLTGCLLLTVLPGLLLGACTATPQNSAAAGAATPHVGILLYGDTGYDLNYPDQDDFEELFTEKEYLQKEWDDWVEDRRPPDEFEARPWAISPVTGKVVPATGMDAVSAAMTEFCAGEKTCNFGLMLGDNIYPSGLTFGADGRDDADRLQAMFVRPYGNLVADPDGFLTYVALGNHDWETSREAGFAQIEFLEKTPGFYMDGPFYTVKPPAGNGEVELFVIDTNMMLASVPVYEDYLDENGEEVVTEVLEEPDYFVQPLSEQELNMAVWLEDALQSSTAAWKIVVAHHPFWASSGSKFEQGRALRKLILPTVCRYADVYIAGHEHTLEVHTDDCSAALGKAAPEPLVQVISGAVSKQRPVNTWFMGYQNRKYSELNTLFAKGLLWGFAYLEIEGNDATLSLISVPDDGSSERTVEFTYRFEKRSPDRTVAP